MAASMCRLVPLPSTVRFAPGMVSRHNPSRTWACLNGADPSASKPSSKGIASPTRPCARSASANCNWVLLSGSNQTAILNIISASSMLPATCKTVPALSAADRKSDGKVVAHRTLTLIKHTPMRNSSSPVGLVRAELLGCRTLGRVNQLLLRGVSMLVAVVVCSVFSSPLLAVVAVTTAAFFARRFRGPASDCSSLALAWSASGFLGFKGETTVTSSLFFSRS
mmetsp:Transcript_27601/g.46189  ORF Transcript_27601/g.46189 Transcript_27601/m.46189 type:complete len:223 (+) Transcript_27601:421-1089(+)